MRRTLRLVVLAALLAGVLPVACAGPGAGPPPPGWPASLRWDLVPRWIAWDGASGKANIAWPPDNGCAGPAHSMTLAVGAQVDRFGSETGNFFSPKGDSFASRAVPYVCRQMDYRVYVLEKPLAVQECKAAAWFNEPGGAEQFQTARPAKDLVADGSIRMVSYEAGGSGGAAPQCGSP